MSSLRLLSFLIAVWVCAGCHSSQQLIRVEPYVSADSLQFQTDDLLRFWHMFDAEAPLITPTEIKRQYFAQASPALDLFRKQHIPSPRVYARQLNRWDIQHYLNEVESQQDSLRAQLPKTRAAMRKLHTLYPDAAFTNIIFVIGSFSTAGVLLPNNQIVIAAEMVTARRNAYYDFSDPWLQQVLHQPHFIPVLVTHEMIHLQQQIASSATPSRNSLLERSLIEGAAEFITEQICGRPVAQHAFSYGEKHEEQLWSEFQKQMNGFNFKDWLYNGWSNRDRPPDLGYFVGYKIAEQYYRQATDKQAALKAIIEMKNARAFLLQSGYPQKFD